MEITYEQIINSPLINRSELASLMWPHNKNPTSRLNDKINTRSGQRLTDKDKELIVRVFLEHFSVL